MDTLRKERLADLEDRTTKVFQTLLSAAVYDSRKGSIKIDRETYRPIVYLEGSEKDPRRISRGIQQLYALALLGGLCKSASNSFPLVIDAPLSGLDDKNKECVLDKFFPTAAEQVILLCLPDESGPQNIEVLDQHVVQKCRLDFDAALDATYVRQNEYF